MTDHNGQRSDKIIAFTGSTELLLKLFNGMLEKGFETDCVPTISQYIGSVIIYAYHIGRCEWYRKTRLLADDYITVTPENIDTFIKNLQP